MRRLIQILLTAHVLLMLCSGSLLAQEPTAHSITLNAAVDLALGNYPAVRASQALAAAAKAGIGLARAVYLPRTDLLWQENRGTRNNIFGILLPQSIIPPLTGPVLESKSFASAWGSAGGLLLSWEPFDFGWRGATVDVARAQSDQAVAGLNVTRLDVATSAADAFLSVIAAQQSLRAAEANVARMQTFAKAVHVLVDNELRPGADASRADAELAAARIQLIQAQQSTEINRALLAEALGQAGGQVTINPGPLLDLPTEATVPSPKFESHPLAVAEAAAVETVRAREHVLARSYFPRFTFQSSFSGRGSGALLDGRLAGGTRGLLPDTPNWASGLSISLPVFDIFAIRSRRRIEAANEAAGRARYDQTIQNLKTQHARAATLVEGAFRIAENTPIELHAARDAEARARARYEAQLAPVTEVAEAQRLLAQAEADDAIARLGVWRALLVAARIQGDLQPFLQRVLNAPAPRRN